MSANYEVVETLLAVVPKEQQKTPVYQFAKGGLKIALAFEGARFLAKNWNQMTPIQASLALLAIASGALNGIQDLDNGFSN